MTQQTGAPTTGRQNYRTAPSAPAGRRRHFALALLALAMGGFGIGTTEFAIMGLLPNVVNELGITEPEGGHLISVYALGVVVGAPVFTALGARWPRKYLLLALMALFTVGNVSSVIAPEYWTLMGTRFAAGLPHGAFFGVASVVAASMAVPTKRARAIAMVLLGLSVANVIGVPFATWLGQSFGWRLMFVVVGLIGAAAFAMIAAFVPFQPALAESSIRRELGALRRVQVWLALLIGVVGFGGFFALYSYIAFTMTEVSGFSPAAIPWTVGLYGAGMVAGSLAGGRLADISVMGSIHWVMVAIAVLLLTFSLTAQNQVAAVVLVFLIGASGSTLVPALQTRLMDVSPDAPSLAASLNHSALNTANALGAFLGGLVIAWGWGYLAPALVGAVLAAVGLVVALVSGALDRTNGTDRNRSAARQVAEAPAVFVE